jgi:outer membrane protein OmpA-like peptidoglycan-associated protein
MPATQTQATPPQIPTAGPLTQAGVGKYMDAQEAELRALMRGRGIMVVRRGNDLLVTFPNDKLFNGVTLSSTGQRFLEIMVPLLRKYDHTLVQVNGYTDTSGTPEQNLDVSQKRAAAVADVLTGLGVPDSRIEVHGFGATNLKVMTGDHVSEPRNRRIEIYIVPRPGG